MTRASVPFGTEMCATSRYLLLNWKARPMYAIIVRINDDNPTHRSFETEPPMHLSAGRCRYTASGLGKIEALKAKLQACGLQDPYIDGVATTSGSVHRADDWKTVQPHIIALLVAEMGCAPSDVRVETHQISRHESYATV